MMENVKRIQTIELADIFGNSTLENRAKLLLSAVYKRGYLGITESAAYLLSQSELQVGCDPEDCIGRITVTLPGFEVGEDSTINLQNTMLQSGNIIMDKHHARYYPKRGDAWTKNQGGIVMIPGEGYVYVPPNVEPELQDSHRAALLAANSGADLIDGITHFMDPSLYIQGPFKPENGQTMLIDVYDHGMHVPLTTLPVRVLMTGDTPQLEPIPEREFLANSLLDFAETEDEERRDTLAKRIVDVVYPLRNFNGRDKRDYVQRNRFAITSGIAEIHTLDLSKLAKHLGVDLPDVTSALHSKMVISLSTMQPHLMVGKLKGADLMPVKRISIAGTRDDRHGLELFLMGDSFDTVAFDDESDMDDELAQADLEEAQSDIELGLDFVPQHQQRTDPADAVTGRHSDLVLRALRVSSQADIEMSYGNDPAAYGVTVEGSDSEVNQSLVLPFPVIERVLPDEDKESGADEPE